jgi:hypothetical protein
MLHRVISRQSSVTDIRKLSSLVREGLINLAALASPGQSLKAEIGPDHSIGIV